jgi:hypothetical protein
LVLVAIGVLPVFYDIVQAAEVAMFLLAIFTYCMPARGLSPP